MSYQAQGFVEWSRQKSVKMDNFFSYLRGEKIRSIFVVIVI